MESRIPVKCVVTYKGEFKHRIANKMADDYTAQHRSIDGSFMLSMMTANRYGKRRSTSVVYLYVPIKRQVD